MLQGRPAAMTIREATTAEDIEIVRLLFGEYAGSLNLDLSFQGFADELVHLPGQYAGPAGALLVAWENLQALGCVAIRPFEPPQIGELKRLYVRPVHRARGIGALLCRTAIDRARAAGYRSLRLDTLPDMDDARRLYRSLGFVEIPGYRYNPLPGAIFMELHIQEERCEDR